MQFLFAIIIATTLYLLQSVYYSRHWADGLSVTVAYNKTHASIGEIITLTEQVKNEKALPIPVLYVKFSTSRTFIFETTDNASISDHYHRNDIFSVMGHQQITRSIQFHTTRRGYYTTEYIQLIVHDLFMRDSYASMRANHTALYVYPALLTERSALSLTNSIIGDISQQNLYEDPLSFRSIREYTNGDNMRYINWKSTAKHNTPMVNTHFHIHNTEVVVLFNLDTNVIQRDDKLQEYMIRIVATLLHHMDKKGFATRLAINIVDSLTKEIITTDLGSGKEHLQNLFEILSRLDLTREFFPFETFLEGTHSLFQHVSSNTSYVIISNYRKEQVMLPYHNLRNEGHSIHFICPEQAPFATPMNHIQYWEVDFNEI